MTTNYTKNYNHYNIYALGLFLVSPAYFFYGLWSGSLYPWDEAWYGEVAREIVVEGKGWLTFHYNYHTWMEKPPLYVWMVAGAFKVFGVNEFAVRIWSALFGFGSVILLFFLTKKLFSSERTAFLSALTLIGFTQFVKQSKMGMMDAPLTFFVLLSIYFLWQGRKEERNLIYVGVITGIAFMIKSFAAFQIPMIIALFLLVSGEWRRLVNPKFIYGFIIGFMICLPWHLYQYHIYGNQFIDEYFFRQIFTRTFEPMENHGNDILHYFKILAIRNIPLGMISLLAIPHILFSLRKEKEEDKRSALILLISSVVVIILLFSLVRTKLGWYILPVYPFLSMLTAVSLTELIDKAKPAGRKKITAFFLIILTAIPILRFVFDGHKTLDHMPELKSVSLTIKSQSGKSDKLLLYEVAEETVILFYSERSILRVRRDDILAAATGSSPFICLMEKKDGFSKELKDKKFGLTVLKETDDLILYKRG